NSLDSLLSFPVGSAWRSCALVVSMKPAGAQLRAQLLRVATRMRKDLGLQREELDTAGESAGARSTSGSQGMLTQPSARLRDPGVPGPAEAARLHASPAPSPRLGRAPPLAQSLCPRPSEKETLAPAPHGQDFRQPPGPPALPPAQAPAGTQSALASELWPRFCSAPHPRGEPHAWPLSPGVQRGDGFFSCSGGPILKAECKWPLVGPDPGPRRSRLCCAVSRSPDQIESTAHPALVCLGVGPASPTPPATPPYPPWAARPVLILNLCLPSAFSEVLSRVHRTLSLLGLPGPVWLRPGGVPSSTRTPRLTAGVSCITDGKPPAAFCVLGGEGSVSRTLGRGQCPQQ
ncbi:unnamed protein product, partial [Rangifer tarandus platyrhynchus]